LLEVLDRMVAFPVASIKALVNWLIYALFLLVYLL